MKPNKEILILKNTPGEGPGLIERVLKDYNLSYRICDYNHKSVIGPVENYNALIVLGGPESANDLSPKMINELSLIRQVILSDLPYLGICLGLQTFVKALDGKVLKSPVKEVGFRDPANQFYNVKLTYEGKEDKLFANLPGELKVFQLHGETVEITPKMTLLATGEHCRNQIVRYGEKAYGIQSHFELNEDLFELWIKEDSDLQELNADQLRSDYNLIKSDYEKTGKQLFTNFLQLSGLI